MRALKISLGTLALFAGSAMAADATLDTARRCVHVKDSLERLVCFDRAFAGTAVPAGQAAPAAPAAAARVPAAAPAVAAQPVVAPVAVAPAVSLGDESVKRKNRDSAEPEAPTSLTAKVTALKETRKDVFRMTLDNGQVWQQMEMDSLFSVAVGDTVQIDKGRLGGYRMARVSNGRSGWARVTRTR